MHTLSLFVIRPNPCGSPNLVAVYVCVFRFVYEGLREHDCVCVFVCVWGSSVKEAEMWKAESCKHTLVAELKPSIGHGMLSHTDRSLTLIND